jgi:hypothetical protein
MAKYLLLKHYRLSSGPEPVATPGADWSHGGVPMARWTPDEIDAHIAYMRDFAAKLKETGEFVDEQALSSDGAFVRYGGPGRPPVTDGPFAETKDLIAGWMVIDVDGYQRALDLAGELSAAPGKDGQPIYEWLEIRPFYSAAPTVTE